MKGERVTDPIAYLSVPQSALVDLCRHGFATPCAVCIAEAEALADCSCAGFQCGTTAKPPPCPVCAPIWSELQREVERLRAKLVDAEQAGLRLAAWTQHHAHCARAGNTAERCTCGLQEAWEAFR